MCWCCGGRSVTRVRSLSRLSTGGRNFAQPQTRGDCSIALKFESSETVHESTLCRCVPGEPSGTSFAGENAWHAIKGNGRVLNTVTTWQFLPHSRQAAPVLPESNLQAPV